VSWHWLTAASLATPHISRAIVREPERELPRNASRSESHRCIHRGNSLRCRLWLIFREKKLLVWTNSNKTGPPLLIQFGLLREISTLSLPSTDHVTFEDPYIVACVWESVVIEHERLAWISDMLSGDPSKQRYLSNVLADGFY